MALINKMQFKKRHMEQSSSKIWRSLKKKKKRSTSLKKEADAQNTQAW